MYSYCQYIIILTANKMLQFNLTQLQRIKPCKILVLHSTRNQNREPPISHYCVGILPSTGTNHAIHNSNFCLDGALD